MYSSTYVRPVYSTASFNFFGQLYDFGEAVLGHQSLPASAAFSIDERRILMVDEDVVAVVRNLHYDEIIATNNENTIIKIYWALI